MKLTHGCRYAIQAVAFLASQKHSKPIASHDIADEVGGIPERFLLKVLKPLVNRGVLTSVRGPEGGYQLARAAKDITLLEVVEADNPIRGEVTFKKKENKGKLGRRLEVICDEAASLVRRHLQKIHVSDLIGRGR
jgi:Rrf2 family transcriptional regulator, iron-sulfur cluster assembly transcription factor